MEEEGEAAEAAVDVAEEQAISRYKLTLIWLNDSLTIV